MEDIMIIKKKTFELKQYANALLNDIDGKIAEERKKYKASVNEVTKNKDEEIRQLNGELSDKSGEITFLRKENEKLMTAIKNIKNTMDYTIKLCEGAE